MNESVRLSIKRIQSSGPDSPMLHNDAQKLADFIVREHGDPLDDPEYQAFYEECGSKCRCQSSVPCGGVLAGGMCDELRDDRLDGLYGDEVDDLY